MRLVIAALTVSATAPGQGWSPVNATPQPSARAGHAAVFDEARNNLVLFGGYDGQNPTDTWTWNGTAWTRHASGATPPGRTGHILVYDAARREVVLFGGASSGETSDVFQDTWVWNGTSWTRRNPINSPPARIFAAAAYDRTAQRVVLFGGASTGPAFQDTWAWDGANWSLITTQGNPAAQFGHAMVFDEARNAITLWGADGTWILGGTAWTRKSTGTEPPQRSVRAMAYHAGIRQVLAFGGGDSDGTSITGSRNDTWTWDGQRWTQLNGSAPPVRLLHSMAYDRTREEMLVFGGYSGADVTLRGDFWRWRATETAPQCAAPSITTQPASQTVRENQDATLRVVASGTAPLRYQWYHGSAPDTSSPWVTTASVTFGIGATANFWVRVTNDCGSVDSNTVTVTVTRNGYRISGTVRGVAASISLAGSHGHIDSLDVANGGLYTFSALANGTYLLEPSAPGSAFDPPFRNVTIASNDAGGMDFTVKGTPIRFTSQPTIPAGTLGVPYITRFAATGGNSEYLWSLVALNGGRPPGLTLNSQNGTLAGTPTQTGTYRFAIQVGTIDATLSRQYELIIQSASCTPPTVTRQPQSQTITAGQTATLTVAGNGTGLTYQWYRGSAADTSNPIDGATATTLTVRPTETASYWVRVGSTCGSVDSATATITIGTPLRFTSPATIPDGMVGVPYSETFTATGGSSSRYSWLLVAGSSLPPGLELNIFTGLLSGTPNQDGFYRFAVQVSTGSESSIRSYDLTIAPEKPTVVIVPGILGTMLRRANADGTTGRRLEWLSDSQLNDLLKLPFPQGQFVLMRHLLYNDDRLPASVSNSDVAQLLPAELINLATINADDPAETRLTCGGSVPAAAALAIYGVKGCQDNFRTYTRLYEDLSREYDTRTFPYDWRKDIRDVSRDLYEFIRQLPKPVAIVAHSMGGLVVEGMFTSHPEIENVTTVITLGTPFRGSVDAYSKLQGWSSLLDKVMYASASRALGANWFSPYQLLPQWNFTMDERGQALSPKDTFAGKNKYFPALLNQASLQSTLYDFWDGLSSKPSNRQAFKAWAIIGAGRNTLGGYHVRTGTKKNVVEPLFVNGDGTVPLDESGAKDRWNARRRYVAEDHAGLPGNEAVRQAILTILKGQMPTLATAPPASQPVVQVHVQAAGTSKLNGSAVRRAGADEVTPGDLPSVRFSVMRGDEEVLSTRAQKTPDAGMLELGEDVLVWVPASENQRLSIESRGSGTFEVLVRTPNPKQGTIEEAVFPVQPLTASSAGYVRLAESPVMMYDPQGAGAYQTISPTISVPDCLTALSSKSWQAESAGGPGAIRIFAPSGCHWTAGTRDSWIALETFEGDGSGDLAFTVAANNSSSARTGTVRMGDREIAVTQAAGASRTPASIVKVSGDGQIVSAGQSFPQSLVVSVLDAQGGPLAGVAVTFVATSVANPNEPLGQVTGPTGSDGRAQVPGALITTLFRGQGAFTVTARVGTLTAVFELAVRTGQVASLKKVSGDQQTTTASQPFGSPLVVQVDDTAGVPVAGLTVSWQAVGPVLLSPASDIGFQRGSSITDANGRAAIAALSSSSLGPGTVTATLTNGPSAVFTLTVQPAGPRITAQSFWNAASREVGLVPCGLGVLEGAGIAPGVQGTLSSTALPFPFTLAGVSLSVNGVSAPLQSLENLPGSQRLTFQTPCETRTGTATVAVTSGATSTTVQAVRVQTYQPGIFEVGYAQYPGLFAAGEEHFARAYRPDGSLVSSANPARRGEEIALMATGLGQTTPQILTNATGLPEQVVTAGIIVGVNDSAVRVTGARYEGGGMYRVLVQMPATTLTGPARPVSLAVAAPDGALLFGNSALLPIQ